MGVSGRVFGHEFEAGRIPAKKSIDFLQSTRESHASIGGIRTHDDAVREVVDKRVICVEYKGEEEEVPQEGQEEEKGR